MFPDRGRVNPEEDDDEITLPEEQDDAEGGDAGSLDNEGGDASQAGQELEDDEGQERQVNRSSRRIQTLRRETQEANDRAARLERELNEERARQRQPAQSQEESDEAFNARTSLLDPEQRLMARLERSERRNQQQLMLANMRAEDAGDKAAFMAKAGFDPRYRKYGDRVEQLLAEERRQGRNHPREVLLRYILGEAVLTNQNKSKQKEQGQRNINRQQARADAGRSDVSTSRSRVGQGDTFADLEKRLEGKFI